MSGDHLHCACAGHGYYHYVPLVLKDCGGLRDTRLYHKYPIQRVSLDRVTYILCTWLSLLQLHGHACTCAMTIRSGAVGYADSTLQVGPGNDRRVCEYYGNSYYKR